MASESSGTKNQPYFAATGAPAIDVDPGLVSDYAAKVGNTRVGTTTDRNSAAGKDLWVGLEWFDTTENALYVCLTGGWARILQTDAAPYAMAAGTANFTGTGGSSSGTQFWDGPQTVTFPVGRFTVPPIVTVGANTPSNAVVWPWITEPPTLTSFKAAAFRITAAPLSSMKFSWIAIQMTPAAAAG